METIEWEDSPKVGMDTGGTKGGEMGGFPRGDLGGELPEGTE